MWQRRTLIHANATVASACPCATFNTENLINGPPPETLHQAKERKNKNQSQFQDTKLLKIEIIKKKEAEYCTVLKLMSNEKGLNLHITTLSQLLFKKSISSHPNVKDTGSTSVSVYAQSITRAEFMPKVMMAMR